MTDDSVSHSRPSRGVARRCGALLIAVASICAIVATHQANASSLTHIGEPAQALIPAERGEMRREIPEPPPGKIIFPVEPGAYCSL
ncbi:MAG: hypothetical protein WBP59_04075, partial [Ilumatobacteraceae bacterium]